MPRIDQQIILYYILNSGKSIYRGVKGPVKYVRFNELSCYIKVIFHIFSVTGVITENVRYTEDFVISFVIPRTLLSQLYTALLSLLSLLSKVTSFGISVILIFIFIFLLWTT